MASDAQDSQRSSDSPILIGKKIKSARLSRDMRLRELAERSGFSESLISKIENDKSTPSLATLHRIAQALGTNISWLFSETDEPEATVLRAGERESIRTDKEKATTENLVPYGDNHLLQGFLIVVEPGGHSQGTRQHLGEEVGYVIDGEMELTVGSSQWLLRKGDSFTFRSEKPHAYRNSGKKPATVIWINTPATL